jgi:hypothetical protein
MSLRLEEAEWDDGRLEIEGRVRPGGVTVTIIDADTKQVLGTIRADRDGEFETKLRLTKSPCRVQVKAGSLTSATRRVEDARGCWSRSRHEEDD